VRFVSPNGHQFFDAIFSADRDLISGNANDGVYQYMATVPQFSQKGTWHLQSFLLVDQVGNQHVMTESDVSAAGFPTTFTVG
jgi:hypothetical protein